MELHNNWEQPQIEDSNVTDNQPTVNTDSVSLPDGSVVSIEELKNWYMRHSDYTKKTQQLSQERKQIVGQTTTNTEASEQDELLSSLSEIGVAKKDDFTKLEEKLNNVTTTLEQKELDSFNVNLTEVQKKNLEDFKRLYPEKSYKELAVERWIINEAELLAAKTSAAIPSANIGIKQEKKENYISDKNRRRFNLKSSDEIRNIRQQFWL